MVSGVGFFPSKLTYFTITANEWKHLNSNGAAA